MIVHVQLQVENEHCHRFIVIHISMLASVDYKRELYVLCIAVCKYSLKSSE